MRAERMDMASIGYMNGLKKLNAVLCLRHKNDEIKYFTILILFVSSCGTTGHIAFFDFDAGKSNVEYELLKVIKDDSAFLVPDKWLARTNGDYFQ